MIRTLKEQDAAEGTERPTPPILLWQVNRFIGQTLQLVTLEHRPAPTGQHRDSELTRKLAGAVRINDAEVLSKVYPSSHPLRVGTEILTELLFKNAREGLRLQLVRSRDALAFLAQPTNLIHYAGPSIARQLYERFEREGIEFGLLTKSSDEPDRIEINVEGKTPRTVLRGTKEDRSQFTHRMARIRAEDAVVAEYGRKQSNLRAF